MKGEAQQAAFIFAAGLRVAGFDVEKFLRVAAVGTFFDDENFPGLIDHEHPARTVRRLGHPDRAFVGQLGENRLERDWRQRLRTGGEGEAQQAGGEKLFMRGKTVCRRRRVSTGKFLSVHGGRALRAFVRRIFC